ncbi:MAG: flagellar biosynthetic protein FliR [Lachnospiraceae bacterium]
MIDVTVSLKTFEVFLLVLVRMASFVSVAPFFGTTNTPARIKIGFSLFVSILVCRVIPMEEIAYTGILGYSVIVLKEVVTGLMIGFGAYICTTIIFFAGNMMDMDMGLSMATMFDPTTKMTATISGNLYYYIIMMLLIVSNMHWYILRAVIDSYTAVPIGTQAFQWEHLVQTMIRYMGDSLVIAFRIELPVFVCIMILNCVLGIMAKVSPQMNMFSVGMQMKLLVGFTVLFLIVRLVPSVSNFIFKEMRIIVVEIIKGMTGA